MKVSSKTALGGIVAALSLSLMFLISIIPMFTYAVPAAASMLLIPIVIEISKKWALGVYFAISLLGLIIVPNKEVAVIYVAFFGYYPVLKAALESHMKIIPEWIVKIFVFNCSILGSYFLMLKLMGITIDELEKFGWFAIPFLLAFGTFAFILYDYALTKVIALYISKFQRRFKRLLK